MMKNKKHDPVTLILIIIALINKKTNILYIFCYYRLVTISKSSNVKAIRNLWSYYQDEYELVVRTAVIIILCYYFHYIIKIL